MLLRQKKIYRIHQWLISNSPRWLGQQGKLGPTNIVTQAKYRINASFSSSEQPRVVKSPGRTVKEPSVAQNPVAPSRQTRFLRTLCRRLRQPLWVRQYRASEDCDGIEHESCWEVGSFFFA